jgi:hypothetical protein
MKARIKLLKNEEKEHLLYENFFYETSTLTNVSKLLSKKLERWYSVRALHGRLNWSFQVSSESSDYALNA